MYGEVRRAGRRWSGDTASSGEASGDTTSLGEGSGDTASSGQGRYRELLRASWGEREVSDRQNLAPNVSPYTTTYSCMETRPWSCTETCPRCLRGVSVHDDYGRVSVHDYRYGPASVHYTEVSRTCLRPLLRTCLRTRLPVQTCLRTLHGRVQDVSLHAHDYADMSLRGSDSV